LVLDPEKDWSAAAELFLILTARAELVERVIRPALAQRRVIVLSDRYELSTVAYQIDGRGLPRDEVLAANRLATGGLRPDLTLILDVLPETGRERQRAAGKEPDRMEREAAAMHDRVAEAFRAAQGPGIVHLDGTKAAGQLEDDAWAVLEARLTGTE
jgi:dTMP kinase